MTQPLNYTPKAIEALTGYMCPGAPASRAGMLYLAGKLREAQVFVLPDSGELLDRTKVRPQVPGVVFRPPFPVVALEYTAVRAIGDPSVRYFSAACTKRIALAWDWQGDLPPILASLCRLDQMGPGVVVASIAYFDDDAMWMPVTAAVHIAYDDTWQAAEKTLPPYVIAAAASGNFTRDQLAAARLRALPVALLPEPIFQAGEAPGGFDAAIDSIQSDLGDEVSAYTDLCYALACKNVSTARNPAPAALNKQRLKKGKVPLKDFHVLELAGGEMPGVGRESGDRAAARSHLRRGHIRRLGSDRVTWVNSAIVRGRGFVDKAYAV